MMNPKRIRRLEDSMSDARVIEDDYRDTYEEEKEDEPDMLQHKPFINVLTKEKFDERVETIFQMVGETLARSYGPYGATTIISQYPYYHITKDGFTIQKNIAFDKTRSFVDQIICGLITDICGRLNYSVGDGTTTATVATNSIFQAYRDLYDEIKENRFLPRDVIHKFEEIKTSIINIVTDSATRISMLPKEELKKYIHDIVFVSSNGNEELTDMISSLYEELTYPSISIDLAPDGVTKKKVVNGYRTICILNDKLYVNTDNKTMELQQADAIMFNHKVDLEVYTKILKPLSATCKNRGRHLVCIAPFYDEVGLEVSVSADLRAEYGQFKDINLVLMSCKYQTEHHKKMISGLSMLCGTEILSPARTRMILDQMDKVLSGEENSLTEFPFNIDNRNLFGTRVLVARQNGQFSEILKEDNKEFIAMQAPEGAVTLGYFEKGSLGLDYSTFSGFSLVDKGIYETYLIDAEDNLKEMERKYQALGSFNVEVDQAQERLNALRLSLGVLEVGSSSTFDQGYLKDAMTDCVKASKSAYKFGVVPGCSVSILTALQQYREEHKENYDPLTDIVWRIFHEGFKNVYLTILRNMDPDLTISLTGNVTAEAIIMAMNDKYRFNIPMELSEVVKSCYAYTIMDVDRHTDRMTLNVGDLIIRLSVILGKPFDLVEGNFSDSIINSVETDIQILHATSDLIKLLITGNQLVVSMYGQYTS